MIVESTSNFTTAFVYQQRHIANFTAFAALMPVWLWFSGPGSGCAAAPARLFSDKVDPCAALAAN